MGPEGEVGRSLRPLSAQRVVRAVSSVAQLAVIFLLGLPFIAFSSTSCSASIPRFKQSGYQALIGFDLPTKVSGFSPPAGTSESVIHIQPDPWLALLILVAIVGGTAGIPLKGLRGSIAGMATAVLGVATLLEAIHFVQLPPDSGINVDLAVGVVCIMACFTASLVLDLGWISGKSWAQVVAAAKSGARVNRARLLLVGIPSTVILAILAGWLIFLGVLLVLEITAPSSA